MNHPLPPLLLLLALFATPHLGAQRLNVGQLSNQVVTLAWEGVEGEVELQRRFPFETNFSPIATTTASTYTDTIPFHCCGDTIRYRLLHLADTLEGLSIVEDLLPTSMPQVERCTVDSLSQRIHLYWGLSPDADIMGYILCSRDDPSAPWLAEDTLWSASAAYIIMNADARVEHYYRLYAFDSCLTASAMTDPLGNMVLRLSSDPNSPQVTATWSASPCHFIDGPLGCEVELLTFSQGQEQPNALYLPASQNQLSFSVPEGTTRALVTILTAGRRVRSNTVEASFSLPEPPPPPAEEDTSSTPTLLWLPNAFTPDESTNQRFCVQGQGLRDYELSLYDRSGRCLFLSHCPTECWDGTLPSGRKAAAGSYVYRLHFIDSHGSPQVKVGTITLIR